MPQVILYIENLEDKIIVSDAISCYVVNSDLPQSKIKEVQAQGKMVLSFGPKALDVCLKYNLDGVIKEVDPSKPVKPQLRPLREKLRRKTLGIIIPLRRHEAMLASEIEPEFIAFKPFKAEQDREIIDWYNDLFLIPSVWVAEDEAKQTSIPDVDFVMVKAKNFENFGC